MSDPNPAQGGSPASGGGTGATASSGGNTAGQSASANPGLTLEAIQGVVQAAVAPLQAKITSLENQANAARRAGQKEDPKPTRIDPSALPENVRPMFEAQQAELDRLKQSEAQRAAAEAKAARTRAIDALIVNGKYANPQIMRDLIEPRLREGATGEIVYDHNGRTLSLEQAVQDLGTQDVFRPAPGGNGAGPAPSAQVGSAPAPQAFTAEQIHAMSPADRAKLRERVKNGEEVAFKD